jgi:hypothetical protein
VDAGRRPPYPRQVVTPLPVPENAGLQLEAARRLRHDLGKYIRFSAPTACEAADEDLRERLRLDLNATRSGPGGTVSAIELFDDWRKKEGLLFSHPGPLREHLDRISASVETLRALMPALESLSRSGLEELDRATLAIAEETRALERAAARETGKART